MSSPACKLRGAVDSALSIILPMEAHTAEQEENAGSMKDAAD